MVSTSSKKNRQTCLTTWSVIGVVTATMLITMLIMILIFTALSFGAYQLVIKPQLPLVNDYIERAREINVLLKKYIKQGNELNDTLEPLIPVIKSTVDQAIKLKETLSGYKDTLSGYKDTVSSYSPSRFMSILGDESG